MKVVHTSKSDLRTIAQEIESALDSTTVLFLSGGSTPKDLYAYWGEHGMERLPGAVAMVDERYGEKWHEKSNELMIKNTGFLEYLAGKGVPFYPIISSLPVIPSEVEESRGDLHGIASSTLSGFAMTSLEESAHRYNETIKTLFTQFPKRVGIMGIGTDAHTAGIPPHVSQFPELAKEVVNPDIMVAPYDIPALYGKGFGPRITLTFSVLDMFQEFFILAFGQEKQEVLEALQTPGDMRDIPLKLYVQPEVSGKVIVLTDQEVGK